MVAKQEMSPNKKLLFGKHRDKGRTQLHPVVGLSGLLPQTTGLFGGLGLQPH